MELLELIKEAGIVGCGGAGFPTHAKLNCKVDTLIVNGAECEPLLRTDRWLMRHKADQVVKAAEVCGEFTGARKIYVALKETYGNEIVAMEEALRKADSRVELFLLRNYYPAGDEQMLVLDVTGRTVPPAGIPLDVGAVVSNVATMAAVCDAMEGKAFTHKYLTVSGEVAHPVIVHAPLGTSFAEVIEAAGGVRAKEYRILCGGPMMGKLYTSEEAVGQVITKTTSGLVVVPPDIPLVHQKEQTSEGILRNGRCACIQCSFCTELCPRHLAGHPLAPHKIMRKLAYTRDPVRLLEDADVRQALTCSECGVCEVYACPMGLKPRQVNIWLKGQYAEAGIRYQKAEGSWEPAGMRDWRKAPSKRMACRLGVEKYYDYEIDDCREVETDHVSLPLKQHIGAPSIPVVQPGEMVECGQQVAVCPEGTLGTDLCASISGQVKETEASIIIERSNP